jgi:hypothetical protein
MATGKLQSLKDALEFLDKCRTDVGYAIAVGALNDAYEWVEEAARAVVQEATERSFEINPGD